MSDKPFEHDELQMRAYLLGELPATESAEVETRVFDNDADYDRLLDAQYDLIDAYARGALTATEREAVEQRLLSHPDGRRHAALARALSVREANLGSARDASLSARFPTQPVHRATDSRWMRLATAAVFVLAAGGLTWLGLDNAGLRRELQDARAIAVPPPTPVTATADAAIPGVAEFALTSRVTRSQSERARRAIEIPSSTRFVRVRIEVNEAASSLTIAIERAGAGRIWTQTHDGARQDGAIVVWIPAEILSSGDYEILVWREREAPGSLVGAYPFRVDRR